MDAKMDLILQAINARSAVSVVPATPVKTKPSMQSRKSASLPQTPVAPVPWANTPKLKPRVPVSPAKPVLVRYRTYSMDNEDGEEDAELPKSTGNPSYDSSSTNHSYLNISSDIDSTGYRFYSKR